MQSRLFAMSCDFYYKINNFSHILTPPGSKELVHLAPSMASLHRTGYQKMIIIKSTKQLFICLEEKKPAWYLGIFTSLNVLIKQDDFKL